MIPLEDNVGDIVGKAQRGLGISDSELAEKARVSSETIRKLREGDFDEHALLSVAPILGLNGQALCELAKGEWHPKKSKRTTVSRNSIRIITAWLLTPTLSGIRRVAWRRRLILAVIPVKWSALRTAIT